jgi:hypothetical protein
MCYHWFVRWDADEDVDAARESCAKAIEATTKAIELVGDDAEHLEYLVDRLNELEEFIK